MKKTLTALVIALSAFGFAQQASAVVLDFETLAHNDDGVVDLGNSYTEDGFVLTDITTTSNFGFSTYGTQNAFFSGSTSLINNDDAGITQLKQVNGGLFALHSISLSTLFPGLTPDGSDVTFTGVKADNSIVSQTFHIADGLTGASQASFAFASTFTNLVSVTWTDSSLYHQFDNIDVTPVPEPDSLALMLAGFGFMGFMARRRLNAQR